MTSNHDPWPENQHYKAIQYRLKSLDILLQVSEVEAVPEFAENPDVGAAKKALVEADEHLKAE